MIATARGVLAALVLVAGCRTGVLEPVPDPLPEALDAWSVEKGGGGFLGIKGTENDSGSLEDLFFAPGVRVTRVVENSPASVAGIRAGDVVLSLDGREVDDPAALDALVLERAAGERASLHVRRDDTVFDVDVELVSKSEASEGKVLYRLDPARTGAGWVTAPGGVRLVSASERSPVLSAGIPLGSVVTALDGRDVRSARELLRRVAALEPGTRVELDFTPPGGRADHARVELVGPVTYLAGFSVPFVVSYSCDPEGPTKELVLLDLWIISLFRYHREGVERNWSFLRFFRFSRGIGELSG